MDRYNVLAQAGKIAARRRVALALLSPWLEGLRPALKAARAACRRKLT